MNSVPTSRLSMMAAAPGTSSSGRWDDNGFLGTSLDLTITVLSVISVFSATSPYCGRTSSAVVVSCGSDLLTTGPAENTVKTAVDRYVHLTLNIQSNQIASRQSNMSRITNMSSDGLFSVVVHFLCCERFRKQIKLN